MLESSKTLAVPEIGDRVMTLHFLDGKHDHLFQPAAGAHIERTR